MKKFVWYCLLILAAVSMLAGCGSRGEEQDTSDETTTAENIELNLWYTDESMTAYMSEAAEAFGRENQVAVIPRQISAIDYLENINQQNIAETDIVDVYILTVNPWRRQIWQGLPPLSGRSLLDTLMWRCQPAGIRGRVLPFRYILRQSIFCTIRILCPSRLQAFRLL